MMKISALLAVVVALGPACVLGSLDAKMKAKGKLYYGSCADPGTFNNNNVASILKSDFGCVTPENSMKWDSTEGSQNNFGFGNADQLANFATSNNLLIRGHTLVWHSQLPGWVNNVNDKAALTAVINKHVSTVAGRFKGKIYAWDVVNEIFEENGSFRNSVFYRVLGEEFVDIAFKAAKAADPAAKLYINDYNLDGPGAKIDAVLAIVQRLIDRGTPIDGIGTQAHLILGQVGGVAAQLARLGSLGLDCAITELDIRIPVPASDATKLAQQKEDYKTVTQACLDVPKCVGITVWGISDSASWVDSTFPSYSAPLLYNGSYQKKPAYDGVDAALSA
ncbi:glycosyl hydrolase family 10 protein [Peziza echinospora]|nr:glycosyl hydrolase family 10 protein [Peziza echinospora]